MVFWISRRPKRSGRAARHAYLGRSSIEPTAILLRKKKYRLIGIGLFTYRAIAGAHKDHQVVEEGHEIFIERGVKLGAEPSYTGSGLVV
jgi:hypothetical protein